MRLVEPHRSDRHDPRCAAIDAAACASKHLSNAARSHTRQAVIHQHRVSTDEDLARDVHARVEVRALPAKVAQGVLRPVPVAWHSYCAACAAWEADPSRVRGHPRRPTSCDQHGRTRLPSTEQAISRAPKHRGSGVPAGLDRRIQTHQTSSDQVRSVPQASPSTGEVIDERPVTPAAGDPARAAAVDLGVNTRAAVTFHQPGLAPLLVNGRPLKAINQWYHQRRARVQANLPEGVYASRPLDLLADTRARQMTAYLQVASRRVVDRLVNHRVGTLVMGTTDGWTHAIGRGKRTTQTCVFVPHARFIALLRYKAELVGIRVVVSDESYTSKCSFLDLEPVGQQAVYTGRRIKRGLFQAADGRRLNADNNGAYNILRQGVPDAFGNGIAGVVVRPLRIALANGAPRQRCPCGLELYWV
jgi:putative transposase